ncbi:hypothetical protein GCM10010503_34110 [Streptomyces lucensis JCM 4490]|uniref:DUF4328 domain-containing protein n=1 Tax=Streptomyces lucensis JCM 4490 TaxID=1306176 RepID=A0A918MSZ6_9ACTN|nr:DUF4328 domain-containing protein [Streptomyces lucensis]GGW54053.1 hypothetical protein GCM10010503_34110 [Streptomyces lucensis JCM 4490]
MTVQIDKPSVRPSGLQPVRWSGRLAVGGLLLAGAAWVVHGVWEIRLALAGEPASGPPDQGDGVHRPLTALENSYHLVTAFGGGAVLLCALSFVSWLWRLRDNARALSGRGPRYGGVWVYLGWIFPVVNLWVPRGIVVDALEATAPGRRRPVSVDVWWGLWLIGMLSGVGIVYRDSTDEIIARAYSEVWPLLASDVAVVAAAVAGVFAVRAVTRVQDERMRAVAGDPER